MKVKDLQTNNILETDNEFVISEWEKFSDRYELVKEKKVKETK